MSARLFSVGTESEIRAAYKMGGSLRSIAAAHGTNATSIQNVLKRAAVARRSAVDGARLRTRDDAFSSLTPDSAYWIGFLLADGCVMKRPGRSATLALALAIVDAHHVRRFADFIGIRDNVSLAGGVARITTSSPQIISDIAAFGVIPGKTISAAIPTSLNDDLNFWRGFIDGDGWISTSSEGFPVLGACGTWEVCQSFAEWAARNVGSRAKPHKIKDRACHQVTIHGNGAGRLIGLLYTDAGTSLPRKAAKAAVLYDRLAKESRSEHKPFARRVA